MMIHRLRRQSKYDESPVCDSCDEPVETGYEFTGEVSGPRGGAVTVCDKCLDGSRRSKTGFFPADARDVSPESES